MSDSIFLVNNSRETFTSDRSGAIATCLWELCRAADRVGTRPYVISRGGDGSPYGWTETIWVPRAEPLGRIRGTGARVRRRLTGWARPDQLAYAKQVVAAVRQRQPQLIVVNNDPEVAVYLRRTLPHLRVLHWFHNLEVTSDRFRRRVVLDPGLRLAAVSDYLARAVETVYGLDTFRLATARNGVDSSRIQPGAASSGAPTIGFLGRLAIEKGIDVLLDSCALLSDRGARFSVELIGDTNWGFSDGGPYAQTVAAGIEKLERAGVSVNRVGHVARDAIPDALARIDIQVVPSRWDDPMPLTVLEGMAAGRAIVASSCGGIPEVLWGVGRMVPRDDPEALAEVLQELLEDDAEQVRLGAAARTRAENLTWDATWAALREAGRR
jgi:glycosyltransferase involved in cell wall biosynthesis